MEQTFTYQIVVGGVKSREEGAHCSCHTLGHSAGLAKRPSWKSTKTSWELEGDCAEVSSSSHSHPPLHPKTPHPSVLCIPLSCPVTPRLLTPPPPPGRPVCPRKGQEGGGTWGGNAPCGKC